MDGASLLDLVLGEAAGASHGIKRVLMLGLGVLAVKFDVFLLHDPEVDVTCDAVVDVLELVLVQQLAILSDTCIHWLEQEAVLPYESFE